MNKIKIVKDFLNSLESEQMQDGQDILLLSKPQENYSAGTSINSRCYNGNATCNSSQNEKNALTKKITATKPTIPEGVKNRNPVGRRRNRNK